MMPHTHSLLTNDRTYRGILAGEGQDREWPHLAPRRQAPRIEVDPYRSTMIRHVIAGGWMCLRRAGVMRLQQAIARRHSRRPLKSVASFTFQVGCTGSARSRGATCTARNMCTDDTASKTCEKRSTPEKQTRHHSLAAQEPGQYTVFTFCW